MSSMVDESAVNHEARGMYRLLSQLFPIHRSITGKGLRKTLEILENEIPELERHFYPTGKKVYDWEIPREWCVDDAYILSPSGEKFCDLKESNLNVVQYSVPVDTTLSLDELKPRLHSIPSQPEAVPYLTSYYKETWGFCISENQKKRLPAGNYRILIDSKFIDNGLDLADVVIKGRSKKEILLSTYVCHPSMANNELSGPVVAVYLYKWLKRNQRNLKYSYRFIFCPETIGAIAYIHASFKKLKENSLCGFILTCMGDNAAYSFLPSKSGNSLADRAAACVLENDLTDYKIYSFNQRGSDERQYCSPKVDIPMCSVMRSKYGEYKEYHTSNDNLDFVSEEGLWGSLKVMKKIINLLEANETYITQSTCEPKLDVHGLYPTMTTKDNWRDSEAILNILAYCDGFTDVVSIVNLCKLPTTIVLPAIESLRKKNLIISTNEPS